MRATSGSVGGVASSRVIANSGDVPAGWRSRRLGSARPSNASSRMCSIGPAVDRRLATVKSHASTRPRRATRARLSARNTFCIAGRRCSIARERVARRSRSARNANVGRIRLPDAVFRRRSATTYRRPAARFFAGRISSARVAFDGTEASSSAQIGWRLPVRASISTTGWRRARLRSMSVIGTIPLRSNARRLSRPGMRTMICWPGLNPSARFQSRGSIRTPSAFAGIAARGSASRLPVGVLPSRLAK
jgi:hypothetical protein